MRTVEFIMGMPISIDIPGCKDRAVFEPVFARLREIDERFSTYKKDSEVSRFRRGEISQKTASLDLKKIIKACAAAQTQTKGYFSANFGDAFDSSGYVKGWAIAVAGKVIEKQGYKTYCIGAGGDILARSDSDKVWSIGIQNPKDKKYLTSQVSAKDIAVATSGTYQRGAHIINPKTGRPAEDFLSLSVIGPDIIPADILATAAFAMGPAGLKFIESQTGYETLAVDKNGQVSQTSGWPA